MKKTLIPFLLSLILCLSVTSCDLSDLNLDFGNWDGKEETVVMYGVVVRLDELNNTCVFFATGGHIAMPRLKSGEAAPEYGVGDLVRVTFTTDGNGIAIMESFPGQIGLGADEIAVKSANVGFEVTEEGSFYTDDIPEGLAPEVGDTVYISSFVEGQNKEVAEGEVTEVTDGSYTIKLTTYGDLENFFMHRFEYGFTSEKK